MPAVSVIVPTYNEERYLRQALDSLTAQTLRDLEVILVNDGSTDGSLAILQEYVEAFPNFHLIDKPNGGYGSAVNTGIAAATGEYVGILEPDDFVNPEMFDELYACTRLNAIPERDTLPGAKTFLSEHPDADLVDVVKSSFWHYWDATEYEPAIVIRPPKDRELPSRITLGTVPELAAVAKDHPAIWACIYRRQFLLDNNLRFIEARGAGWVDNTWLFDTMLSAKTLVWMPKAYYHYRNDNAASSGHTSDYTIPLDRIDDMLAIFERHPEADDRLYRLFARRTLRMLVSIFNGMEVDEFHQDLLDRTRLILSRLRPEAVLDNPDIEETRKIFYREVLGLYKGGLKARGRSTEPHLTILVEAHNNYAFIGGILRTLNKDNPTPNLDIIVQDEGGSWDFTGAFVNDIARVDQRITYNTCSWQETLQQVRTDYIYLLASDATLQKGVSQDILNAIGDADIYVFDSLTAPDCPLDTVPITDIYDNLFDLVPTITNLCVKTDLLRSVVAGDKTWTIQTDHGEHLLRLLLTGETARFVDPLCQRPVVRNLASDSVRTSQDINPEIMHMGSLARMLEVLKERELGQALGSTFRRFAARGILSDLQDYHYSVFATKAKLARETYIPLLLPDLMKQSEFEQRSPEHLLYLLCTDEALFIKFNQQVRIADFSTRTKELRKENAGLRKQIGQLNYNKASNFAARAMRAGKHLFGNH